MENGRPAHNSYHTRFYKNGSKAHVESLKNKTDVSGWETFSGQIDKERRSNGLMRSYYGDGDIEIGQAKNNNWTEARKYVLQENQTHTLYKVKFDENGKMIENKEISRGHKMV